MLAEPVSASSAAAVPGDEYWPLVRQICDRYGVLLIADEVINGFGRTGKMFASEHWDLVPDIMTMAKGLTSSYLPVANAIVTTRVADAFAGEDSVFKQSLTFGGHPVTAAAALKNIEILETEDMVGNSTRVGAHFLEQLESLQTDHPSIGDVRGIGLLLGIEFVQDRETKKPFSPDSGFGTRLDEALKEQGLILRSAGGRTISMGPPLCMTEGDTDEVTARLDRAIGIAEKGL